MFILRLYAFYIKGVPEVGVCEELTSARSQPRERKHQMSSDLLKQTPALAAQITTGY